MFYFTCDRSFVMLYSRNGEYQIVTAWFALHDWLAAVGLWAWRSVVVVGR